LELLLTKEETHKAGDIERKEGEDWGEFQARRERKIAKAQLKLIANWINSHDTYSQYTGQTRRHLVRRLDIPNGEINKLYKLTGLKTIPPMYW